MSVLPRGMLGLVVAVLGLVPCARAAEPPDPLRFYPSIVDLVVKIENPRIGLEAFRNLELRSEAQKLDATRELFERPDVRRFFRLVEYYEREMGTKWPRMLDDVAGGGICFAAKLTGKSDAPFTIAVQGRDVGATTKFKELFLTAIADEYESKDSRSPATAKAFGSATIHKLADDFWLAQSGSALLLANGEAALKLCLTQGEKAVGSILESDKLQRARKLHGAEPIAWLWFDLETVKAQPAAKEILKTPRNDSLQTFAFAGYLDVIRRAGFATAHLRKTEGGFAASISMPAGKAGAAADVALHLPVADIAATLPLLQPKGTLFSHSFYLDLATFWNERNKIFTAPNAKAIEEASKQLSKVLPRASLEKLLQGSGTYHRFVVANVPTQGYTRKPTTPLPAAALVMSIRDAEFGPSVNSMIRAGGFIASTSVKVKIFEETFDGVKMFGYRFPEDGEFPSDPTGLRFNFMPTFATVGDQYIFASSREMCKATVAEIKKPTAVDPGNPNMKLRFSFDGIAELLTLDPGALLTQAILSGASTQADARKQVEAGLKLLRSLGQLNLRTEYKKDRFDFHFDWKLAQ